MDLEAQLLETFVSNHPAEAARALETMPVASVADVLSGLPVEGSAKLLRSMNPPLGACALELVETEQAAAFLSATRRDVAASILRVMPSGSRDLILSALSPDVRTAIRGLLHYAYRTAGALMDPGVLSVAAGETVAATLERVRQTPQQALYYVYVVSEDQRLVGVTNLRELMEARPDQLLGMVAHREVASLRARSSWETVVSHPAWKRVHALPVVERDGRFVGVVRYESIRTLEGRLVETGAEHEAARTGGAVAELYALGLRGLFEWAASAGFGPEDPDRRRS